jgi:hypothetical protein
MKRNNILLAWRLLYLTYGFIPIIVGLDKYFDFLADWSIYLNPHIPQFFNMTTTTFMHAIGIIEIIAGLLVFLRPIIGGYIITLWLVAIVINLISMGTHTHAGYVHVMTHYDVALRDIAMAIGSYVLVLLTRELKNGS